MTLTRRLARDKPGASSRLQPRFAWQNDGYTLVELLIVVALLGILTSMVLPQFQPSVQESLTAVARVASNDLSFCRSLAIMNDSRYAITFDSRASTYTLTHAGSNSQLDTLPECPFGHDSDPDDERIRRFADLPSLGLQVYLAGFVRDGQPLTTTGSIEFASLGELSGGSDVTIWLTAGASTSQRYIPLRINQLSGLIEIGEVQQQAP